MYFFYFKKQSNETDQQKKKINPKSNKNTITIYDSLKIKIITFVKKTYFLSTN